RWLAIATRRTPRSSKSASGSSRHRRELRLVPRRHRLHGRDIQEHRQDDICQGSCVEGPFTSIQLQPRLDRAVWGMFVLVLLFDRFAILSASSDFPPAEGYEYPGHHFALGID